MPLESELSKDCHGPEAALWPFPPGSSAGLWLPSGLTVQFLNMVPSSFLGLWISSALVSCVEGTVLPRRAGRPVRQSSLLRGSVSELARPAGLPGGLCWRMVSVAQGV